MIRNACCIVVTAHGHIVASHAPGRACLESVARVIATIARLAQGIDHAIFALSLREEHVIATRISMGDDAIVYVVRLGGDDANAKLQLMELADLVGREEEFRGGVVAAVASAKDAARDAVATCTVATMTAEAAPSEENVSQQQIGDAGLLERFRGVLNGAPKLLELLEAVKSLECVTGEPRLLFRGEPCPADIPRVLSDVCARLLERATDPSSSSSPPSSWSLEIDSPTDETPPHVACALPRQHCCALVPVAESGTSRRRWNGCFPEAVVDLRLFARTPATNAISAILNPD